MLAHALGRQGIETALVPLYDQAVDVPLLALDALVVNYARPANLDLVRGYHDAGLPVWVLDTEGGILADNGANTPDRLATFMRDSGYSKLLSGYFFWGGELHQAFMRNSGMAPDTLHLTGCPRFDYAAPRWRDLLESDRRGYILVNANFPLVNPLFAKSPEEEMLVLLAAGWQRDYVERLIADSTQIFSNYIATIQRLASRMPQQQFLVRPHPFENTEHYRAAFAGMTNVQVDGRGNVLNVIRHADCVLHLNCGTAVEAVMLDKLPLSMEFLNTPHMSRHSSLPSRVSLRVSSEQELFELVSNLPDAWGRFDFEARHRELIRPWFHLNDGGAAGRVAAVLANALPSDGPVAIPSVRRSLASSRRNARPTQLLQAALANLIGSSAASRLRSLAQPKRRAKQLHCADIDQLLHAIGERDSRPPCRARPAHHPVTGTRLASVLIAPV